MTLPTPRAASAVLATCVLPFASSLGQESEGLHTAPLSRAESHGSAIPAEAGAAEAGAAHAAGEAASSAGAGVAAGAGQVGSEAPPHRRRSARLGPQHVAPLIAVADLTGKLASGLSMRFFSLYFWRELGLPPTVAMLMLVGNNLGSAAWTIALQRLSLRIGRVSTILLVKSCGVSLLVVVALCPLQDPRLILPICLLRSWLMNSTLALSKSVLNDYVPKRHRAKWASLESVNTSTWAGSAALGGLLSDRIGYRHTFLVTAALQAVGVLLYTPLASLVAAEAAPPKRARASTAAEPRACGAGSSFSAPPRQPARAAPLAAPLLRADGTTRSVGDHAPE